MTRLGVEVELGAAPRPTAEEPANLQTWLMGPPLGPDSLQQVHFVRSRLGPLLVDEPDKWVGPREGPPRAVAVVGEHTSRSVRLPVYRVRVGPVTAYLRCNFYDWVVTYQGPLLLVPRARALFQSVSKRESPACCEGFRDEWVRGPYLADQGDFTARLGGEYGVYVLFWHIAGVLGR